MVYVVEGDQNEVRVMKCNDAACAGGDETETVIAFDGAWGITGPNPSVAIGDDDYPVISYFHYDDQALKVVKCNDPACTGGGETYNTIQPETLAVKQWPSIVIGPDGNPVIAFYNSTDGTLDVAKCGDPACGSGNVVTTIDDSGFQPLTHPSVAIGDDGLPAIVYSDVGTNMQRFAHCQDADCSGVVDKVLLREGRDGTIAIGNNGYPVISLNWDELYVIQCGDYACTTDNRTVNTIENAGTGSGLVQYSSIAVPADGNPIIAYQDYGELSLRVARCQDSACAGGSEIINTLDNPANEVGRWVSIALDDDGYPVISHFDETASALKVTKCNDVNCAGGDETTTTMTSIHDVGRFSSIAIGADGFPVISYVDYTDDALRFAKCDDVACASGTQAIVTLDDDLTNNLGWDSSVAKGGDDLPVIAYRNATDGTLRVLKCDDASCADGGEVINTIDDPGSDVGYFASVVMGQDDLPIISYQDWSGNAVKVVKCGDQECSTGLQAVRTVASTNTDDRPAYPAIAIPGDGRPVVSYVEAETTLRLLRCADASCSTSSSVVIETTDDIGDTSVAIGSDGWPVISYHDRTGETLKVAKCSDASCGSFVISTVDDEPSGVGWFNTIAVGSDDLPIISYVSGANQELRIAWCNDLACSGDGEVITIIDGADINIGTIGPDVAMTIGSDNRVIVSYFDFANRVLKAAHCDRTDCVYIAPVPPEPPTNLSANRSNSAYLLIELDWADNSNNESGFRIERRRADEGWGLLKQINGANPTGSVEDYDNTRTCNTTFYYQVQAFNDEGGSAFSNTAFATTGNTSYCVSSGTSGVTTEGTFGSEGSGSDQFSSPGGAEVDSDGNIVIADTANNRVQICDQEGNCTELVGAAGTFGAGQGGIAVGFLAPEDVALDGRGHIIVADTGNHRIQVCEGGSCTPFGGLGTAAGQFDTPRAVAVDGVGRILVADTGNDRVQRCSDTGDCTVIGGFGTAFGRFDAPAGIAAGFDDAIWVADTGNHRIQRCDAAGNCTGFGSFGQEQGQFDGPTRIGMDLDERLVIADTGNRRVQLCNAEGVCTTLGGDYGSLLAVAIDNDGRIVIVDGTSSEVELLCLVSPETAFGSEGFLFGQFSTPVGVATDSGGRIIVADVENHRIQLCDTLGGCTGIGTYGDEPGEFFGPFGVAVDGADRIIVADTLNSRMQVCSDQGVCSVFGAPGDAVGEFNFPIAVTVDSLGRIIVADSENDRIQICDDLGNCTAFGQSGTQVGEFDTPYGVAVDSLDRIIVADYGNDRVQICDDAGNCTAFGSSGFNWGEFDLPVGVTVDEDDRIVISDAANDRIQVCDETGQCSGFGQFGNSPGTFDGPTGLATLNGGRIIVADTENNRIQVMRRCGPTNRAFISGFEN
jgi:hypothetical protein